MKHLEKFNESKFNRLDIETLVNILLDVEDEFDYCKIKLKSPNGSYFDLEGDENLKYFKFSNENLDYWSFIVDMNINDFSVYAKLVSFLDKIILRFENLGWKLHDFKNLTSVWTKNFIIGMSFEFEPL